MMDLNEYRGVPAWRQPGWLSGSIIAPSMQLPPGFADCDSTSPAREAVVEMPIANRRALEEGSGSVITPALLHGLSSSGGTTHYCLLPAVSIRNLRECTAGRPEVSDAANPVDILVHVKERFGLNISQLARACLVQRPTIYKWLQGTPPRTKNLERLAQLRELAKKLDQENIPKSMVSIELRGTGATSSIMDLLSAKNISAQEISQRVLASTRPKGQRKTRSLADSLRKAGYSELPSDLARANLDDVSDMDSGP